jgi:ferrous-iron efflux pump FieF
LLDAAPKNGEYNRIVSEIGRIEGVTNVHAVRIRPSGARWFVDLHVTMDGSLSLTESHAITESIEREVQKILPQSDVTVHVEPSELAET